MIAEPGAQGDGGEQIGSENGLGERIVRLGLLLIPEHSVGDQGQVDLAQRRSRGFEHLRMLRGVIEVHDFYGYGGCSAGEQIARHSPEFGLAARHQVKAGFSGGQLAAGGDGNG